MFHCSGFMRNIFILIAMLIIIPFSSDGQALLLKNTKRHKTITFKKGDEICYKLKTENAVWQSGKIESFDSASVTIDMTKVPITTIAAIQIERKTLNYAADGFMLTLAGVALPAISLLNDLITWDKPSVPKAQLITSVSLVVSGIAIGTLQTKVCTIGKKYSLVVLIF
jgi:hypothetical protein